MRAATNRSAGSMSMVRRLRWVTNGASVAPFTVSPVIDYLAAALVAVAVAALAVLALSASVPEQTGLQDAAVSHGDDRLLARCHIKHPHAQVLWGAAGPVCVLDQRGAL